MTSIMLPPHRRKEEQLGMLQEEQPLSAWDEMLLGVRKSIMLDRIGRDLSEEYLPESFQRELTEEDNPIGPEETNA